jgi:hypothetical protein
MKFPHSLLRKLALPSLLEMSREEVIALVNANRASRALTRAAGYLKARGEEGAGGTKARARSRKDPLDSLLETAAASSGKSKAEILARLKEVLK